MNFKIVKRGVCQALYEDVPKNLDLYLEGDFSNILDDEHMRDVKDSEFDESVLSSMNVESGGIHDAENSFILYNTLEGMTSYLARDERVWVYFTHMPCLEFTRRRWLKSGDGKEKLVKNIKSHFFARGGLRGFERSNAIASLWWWAHIAKRYKGAPHENTLQAFLKHTDLRTSIIERPTTTISSQVFSAIMDAVFKRMYTEPNPEFFVRHGNQGMYREWMKEINRHGGIRLFDARPPTDLSTLFENLAVVAEQNAGV